MKIFEELIKVNKENNTVSARELHEFLGVNTQFTIWFNRMCEYGFNENSDFRLIAQKRPTNNPKNPYTIGTDYRAIAQKRPTARGFFGVYLKE